MKNYEEMAEAVFRRIEESNAAKKRRQERVVRYLVPAVCVCLVALLGLGIWQAGRGATEPQGGGVQVNSNPVQTQSSGTVPSTQVQPSDAPEATEPVQPQPAEPFLYLCAKGGDGQVSSELLQLDQSYETGIYLDFINIQGLTEDQIQDQLDACQQEIQEILGQYGEIENGYHYGFTILRDKGYIISRMAWNFFALDLDVSRVQRIKIENTGRYGQIDIFGMEVDAETGRFPHGQSITLEKEQLSGNITFSWNYEQLNHYMEETDDPTCRDFNDTFHFTVEFEDGTVATATVDIEFQDSGRAVISCRGYEIK